MTTHRAQLAQASVQQLLNSVIELDQQLDGNEVVPSGDDYHRLYWVVMNWLNGLVEGFATLDGESSLVLECGHE